MTWADRIRRLTTRRPGPIGFLLLPLTWILLGALVVAYVVAMLAVGFAAIVVHTGRLFLSPVRGREQT